MSSLAIDQVLAQIRSLSAQAGAGLAPDTIRPASLQPSAAAGSTGFAQLLKQGIDAVNGTQQSADALASAWEKGTPGVDLARVMIETQKASVSFQALTQVRNRLISAYQDIMNMSI
jgi:flagellar hook-basal body complex protein FliE